MNSAVTGSVIIPTCHRNDLLALCLERLAPGRQTLAAERYEVIVSDDGSRSNSHDLLRSRFPWARWVAGPRKGPAANRNCGARQARGQWLAFTDDDCLPSASWLETYARAMETRPQVAVFEGRVHVDRPRRTLAETAPLNEGGKLWSCNLAIRRPVFESLGGFDERFPYAAMEDVDFSLRLQQAGQTAEFLAEAAICHPWRRMGGWKALKQHQQSTYIYLQLHPDQRCCINGVFYLELVARSFLKTTLPGILRYRAAGLGSALLEHFAHLQMAVALSCRSPRSSSNQHPS